MNGNKRRKRLKFVSKPLNLQRIADLNTGTLEDAQTFNLVTPEDDVSTSLRLSALKFFKTLF